MWRSRTRMFTAHLPPAPWPRPEEAVLVKDGFAWPAFFFSALWALWHRLWLAFLLIIAGVAAVELGGRALEADPIVEQAAEVAWMLYIGFEANDWRRRKLARRGFVTAGVVAAPDLAEAERRFFAKLRHRTHDATSAIAATT